ncbi:MAG TPA: DUF72 domain-containing protein [bacterium]|nr:DUF72 domain-containing protein [bacterium]
MGTSSWSSKDWIGVFYPAGTRAADMLPFYATCFNAVEADVTYYRIPSESMIRGWRDRTPDGFKITAKFPREVVHGGSNRVPDGTRVLKPDTVGDITLRFLERMAGLKERCGPLVIQMPYYNRSVFAENECFFHRLTEFLEWLPGGFEYSVEIRNRQFLGPELASILRQHRIPLVQVDIPYMPGPGHWGGPDHLLTGDFIYLRLIGDRNAVEKATDRFDRIVLDRSAQLRAWAMWLNSIRSGVRNIYVFANNHFAGHGPATIREFMRWYRGGD